MADETKKFEIKPGIEETETKQFNPYEIKPSLEKALSREDEERNEAEKIADELNLGAAQEAVAVKDDHVEIPVAESELTPEEQHQKALLDLIEHAGDMTGNAGIPHNVLKNANEVHDDEPNAPTAMQ